MQLFFTRLVSLLMLSVITLGVNAQNNFFADAAENSFKATKAQRVIIPVKYRTLRLDSVALLSFLKVLPSEQNITNRNTLPVIELPMPGGKQAKFRVWESSAMAPELAAAYPFIRTFTGQGVDDPTASIKLDYTEYGFHAMILSAVTGSVFIDPYSKANNTEYISYFKSDFKKTDIYKELPPIKKNNGTEAESGASPANVLSSQCIGNQLHTYRLAVACTGEYAVAATGVASPTKAQTLAKIVTSVNRVNGVYEKEVDIRMVLIANDTAIIFTNPATDPYTANNDGETLLGQNQTQVTSRIGSANYDIGHIFSTGGGGIASLGSVCVSSRKAQGVTGLTNPVGDAYDIDYVAHEMGHQFGGNHTFNSENGACGGGNVNMGTNSEPGSGSTIMAYAGICSPEDLQQHSDPQFNALSFDEISTFVLSGSGRNCAVNSSTGNSIPVVNAGSDYTIPQSTPFFLSGTATDANDVASALTYSWEEVDVNGPTGGSWNAPTGDAPIFRSFAPLTNGVRYFPKLSAVAANTVTIGEILPTYARTMHFRLTVRDNRAGGGGVCFDQNAITVNANTGPFLVSYPNATGVSWIVNDFKTITWDPAGTATAPINCSNVNIELSTDGGFTFPVTIVANTPNDGTQEIQIPNNISTQARIRVVAVGNIFYDISDNNFSIVAPASPSFVFNNPANIYVCGASSGTATLNSAKLGNFTTTIALSASLNPAGTTVSFGTASLTPGSSTTVTLNNTSGLAAGAYTVRVTGLAGSVTKTRDLTFVVGTGAGAPTSLTLPANDAIGVDPHATFNWSAVVGTTSYTIEISTVANFSSIVQTVANVSSLPYTITTGLAENTVYYWRVRAVNSCGPGAPSATANRFKTGYSGCRYSTDVPKVIPAAGTSTTISTLTIPAEYAVLIEDVNVIGLTGTHTNVSNLTFTLTSPSGTTTQLLSNICNGSTAFDLNLDQQSGNAVNCPPTDGQIAAPSGSLSVFNDENSSGVWTLTVTDASDGNTGSLTGWGLNINGNGQGCTIYSTPLAIAYTFIGNGNWSDSENWSAGGVPPSPLPAGYSIIINNEAGGQCVLNVNQTISPGASLTVLTGKNLIIPGTLTVQ